MIECFKNDFSKFYQQLEEGKGDIEEVLPAATETEVKELETALSIPLPESYKKFLRCSRGFWLEGGVVQFGDQHPFFHNFPKLEELNNQQLQAVKKKGGIWPPPSQGMLCFAEFSLEADGDQVMFDVSAGLVDGEYPVMYYAHENSPASLRKLSDSFSEWVENIFQIMEGDDEE